MQTRASSPASPTYLATAARKVDGASTSSVPEFTRAHGARSAPVDGGLSTVVHKFHGRTHDVQRDVHAGGKNGADPLKIAFKLKGDPEAVKSRSRFTNNTLLHEACTHWQEHPDQADLIDVLVKAGVDVNAKNNRNETPLDIAVKKLGPHDATAGQKEAVIRLLQNHAEPTPAAVRRGEELATKGNAWLKQQIEKHAGLPRATRL